jgi:hypothetical protein
MSYYTGPMSYYQSPVRWDQDEKTAPVPGWGMWLSDVGHKPQIIGANGFGRFGDATTDPTAPPASVATAATGLSSSLGYVFGGLVAGAVIGYLIGKGR